MARSTKISFFAIALTCWVLASPKTATAQQTNRNPPPVRLKFSDESPSTGRVAKRKITKANRIPSEVVLGKGPTVRLVTGEEPATPAQLPARLRAKQDLERLPPARSSSPAKHIATTQEPVAPNVEFDTSTQEDATWAIPSDTQQAPREVEAFRPRKNDSRPTRNVQATHVAWDGGDNGVRPAFWSEQTRLAQADPLSELERAIDQLDRNSQVAPTPPTLRRQTTPSTTKPLSQRRRLRLDFLPEDEGADGPLDRLERATGRSNSDDDYPYQEVPIVPTPPKRQRMPYAYTLADILDDDDETVDPCIEQAYCNAVWACAGGKCLRPIDRWRRDWNRNRIVRNGSCNPEYRYRSQGPNFNRNAYLGNGFGSNDLKYQIEDGRGPARISDDIQYAGHSVRPADVEVRQVDYEAEDDEIWYRAKR